MKSSSEGIKREREMVKQKVIDHIKEETGFVLKPHAIMAGGELDAHIESWFKEGTEYYQGVLQAKKTGNVKQIEQAINDTSIPYANWVISNILLPDDNITEQDTHMHHNVLINITQSLRKTESVNAAKAAENLKGILHNQFIAEVNKRRYREELENVSKKPRDFFIPEDIQSSPA